MSFRRNALIVMLVLFAGSALAADNAGLVNKPVRVQVSGVTEGAVSGKLIAVEGCLYVQFDRKTKDGFASVRLDQVTNLQFTAAGRIRRFRPCAARSRRSASKRRTASAALQIRTSESRLIHRV